MKNKNAKEIIFTILLLPIVVLFLLGLLVITPIDYFKYKRSYYYKDTKERYSWLCTSSYYVKFYDMIKKEKLPIKFYRCKDVSITGYGYFVFNDTLILNDYDPYFDEERNTWLIEIEDKYVDIKDDVDETIAKCNEYLKGYICKKAVVLIDKELFDEEPNVKYENFEFLPVGDGLNAEALKSYISTNF